MCSAWVVRPRYHQLRREQLSRLSRANCAHRPALLDDEVELLGGRASPALFRGVVLLPRLPPDRGLALVREGETPTMDAQESRPACKVFALMCGAASHTRAGQDASGACLHATRGGGGQDADGVFWVRWRPDHVIRPFVALRNFDYQLVSTAPLMRRVWFPLGRAPAASRFAMKQNTLGVQGQKDGQPTHAPATCISCSVSDSCKN